MNDPQPSRERGEAIRSTALLAARKIAIEEIVKAVPSDDVIQDAGMLTMIRVLVREVAGAGFDAGVACMANAEADR